jgi:hypothetical protein
LRYDFIAEHKHSLVQEAEEQAAAEVGELKRKLAEETRPLLEGNIAREQRVNSLIDGMREETRGFGKNKKPHTIIEIPNMTNEQALTVLKAAQQSAKDRASVTKFKAERDTAITDKNAAIAERDTAINAQKAAEKKQQQAETAAKTAESNATKKTEEADAKMKQANALYYQQQNLNHLFQQATKDRDIYKSKADKTDGLAKQITELKQDLRNAYTSVGAMAKANGCLLFDEKMKIPNITPEQERLLKATRTYAAAHSRNSDFEDIAQDIEKHYGLTKGMQNHVDELTPKPQTKKRSYDHDRG